MQPLASLTSPAPGAPDPVIRVRGLGHSFPSPQGDVRVLDGLDLDVAPGSFTVVVGPSGCGKSSLLMMLAGLSSPREGSILCAGAPLVAPDPNRVGVVFQDANLYPWLTAVENIAFPLMLRGVARGERTERARAMLELVGLTGAGQRRPAELSGGMRQRVAIARGLVQDPPVLLMDEPFSALDEQTRMSMGEELLRIWARTDKTILFVTHSLTEAVFLADEVLVMAAHPGRIIDRVAIDLPRPRDHATIASPKFGVLRERIWSQIRRSTP